VEKYGEVSEAKKNNIIRRMRTVCWITKATNTHPEHVTHRFSMTTVVIQTRLNIKLYVNYLSCYILPDQSDD
jgi:hypothetical protein